MTRKLFTGYQPNQSLRNTLSQRPSMPGGSIGVVTFTLAVMSICYKSMWLIIVKRTRECDECRGFGIQPCELCHSSGSIKWIGKWDHVEPCPQCMGKRYHRCSGCGGLYHRSMFKHVSRNAGLTASQDQALKTVDILSPLVD
jgi:DnaJ-class molecular chaperone